MWQCVNYETGELQRGGTNNDIAKWAHLTRLCSLFLLPTTAAATTTTAGVGAEAKLSLGLFHRN
jgi:hypothetical protein